MYILPNSDASTKDMWEETIYAINGTQLTVSIIVLLALENRTLNLASYNGAITPNGRSVALTKQQ
jgi:hypothetical protein